MNTKTSLGLSLLLLFVLALSGNSAQAGLSPAGISLRPEPLTPWVGEAVRADHLPSLRGLQPADSQDASTNQGHAALPLPKALNKELQSPEIQGPDPVLQDSPGAGYMPDPINNFEGVGNENLVLPPDTQGDIGYDPATGRKYYVQWVNLSFAIWDVTGTPDRIYGPVSGNTLWKNFGGPCENTNHGDPITLYDPLAQRWLMSQFSVDGPFYQCIAISQSGDPTGGWFRYAFLISSTKMNDYPHLGVWPDGYYMTINQFGLDNSWGGTGAVVFNREKMLAGQNANFLYFDLYAVDPNFGGMLPSDLDGSTPPPPGAPNYFVEVDDSTWIGPQDAMRLWEFHVDWDNPANTTFGINGQPNATLPTAAWTPLCEGISACIPQPNTSYTLDAIGDRLMHRLAYRNFGDHESLVVNHTVDAGSGHAGVRWYEVRDPGGTPVIYQQGTYAPDSNSRWMGSIAQDRMGNIALGYSVSSSSVYPSVRYTGRLAEDPLDLMTQNESVLVAGGGSQTHASSRWGDYSMMSVDPLDDCTFWYTQEYYATTSSSAWKTRIGSFRFPGCSDASLGKLTGLITDASSGLPIPGATLKASSGPGVVFQTISGDDGRYNLLLDPGNYTLSVSSYGYFPQAISDVQIDADITTTVNFALDPTEKYVVSGVVHDIRTGWPLYARIIIQGDPLDPPPPDNEIWTDPLTGAYSVTLAEGEDYHFQVDAWSPGYLPASYQTGVLAGPLARDFSLTADSDTCIAPGYTRHSEGFGESFDSNETPSGWSVLDNAGSGVIWRFDNPKPRPNYTGGSENFAIIDSDYGGPLDVDTEMHTPGFDLSTYPTATLEYKSDFYWYDYGQAEYADVDLSVDGGDAWTNVWRRSGGSDRGPKTARLDISSLAGGKPDVRVRFHYYNANFEWWWQVDDFFIGRQSCDPGSGGLVVGEVSDANTTGPIDGALVSSDSGETATAGISSDPQMTGAFYAIFSPSGSHAFTATAGTHYGPVVQTTAVKLGEAVHLDFSLPAGLITANPQSIDLTLKAGLTTTQLITLTNTGALPANFELSEVNAPLSNPSPSGPFAPAERRVSPAHLNDPDARTVRIYEPPDVSALPAGDVVKVWDSGLPGAWGLAYDPASGKLWVGDIGLRKGDDRDHGFQEDGVPSGESIDTAGWSGAFAASMTFDPFSGRLWQVNVGGDNCVYELDTRSLSATGHKLCPGFGVSMRGLAYDPLTNTFYSGSWNDQILYHFDDSGRLLDSTDVRLNIASLAYNPVTGHLFVMSNAATGYDVYVLDVMDNYALLGGFNIPGLGDFEQAGLALDCNGSLWAVNQVTGQVIEANSGEKAACNWSDIPWLSAVPAFGSLESSAQQEVVLSFDAQNLSPGAYPAYVRVTTDTPYEPLNLPVTLTVRLDYDFTITPDAVTMSGAPGEQVVYSLEVENTGLKSDEYKLDLQDAQWPAQAPNALGPLAPGERVTVPVTVTVPLTTGCNTGDLLGVLVTSRSNPDRTAVAALNTLSSLICSVQLEPEENTLWGVPGDVVAHRLRLTNTGNITDTFTFALNHGSADWKVEISPGYPDGVTLPPAAGVDVSVRVTIPSDAVDGSSDQAILTVSSGGDPSQFDSSVLTTQVKEFRFYLPVVPYR